MISIKQNLLKICFVFFSLFSSCDLTNRAIMERNSLLQGAMNEFSNDSLRLKFEFYGNTNLGDEYISISNVKKAFIKSDVKFPKKDIIFWGNYTAVGNPMYVVGSLRKDIDLRSYSTDTSDFGNLYFYRVSNRANVVISEVAIPYSNNGYLSVKEISLDVKKSVLESFQDARSSLEVSFSKLVYGENYSEIDVSGSFDFFVEAETSFKNRGFANYLLAKDTLEQLLLLKGESQYGMEILKSYQSFLGERVYYNDIPKVDIDTLNLISTSIQDLFLRIQRQKVVMFNENHLSPKCRLLVNMLLPRLYADGFKVLALEGLNEGEGRVNKEGFPNIEDGFYTRDPNMANLIRTAKRIGYKVISYEDINDSEDRDSSQAANLIEKSHITSDNDVKIVLLGGGGHIEESSQSRYKSMAQYFKERTNIDPFTINQVKFLPQHMYNDSIYIVNVTESLDNYDLFVVNGLESSRIYLGDDLKYESVKIPPVNNIENLQLALYIYDYSEYTLDRSAIPVFSSYSTNDTLTIDIPEGRFIYHIKDRNGDIIDEKILRIP